MWSVMQLLSASKTCMAVKIGSGGEAAVAQLVGSFRHMDEKRKLDTKSPDVQGTVAAFLSDLEAVSSSLQVERASRCYRSTFTPNYRHLFPGTERNYRVDILEACLEKQPVIWVNGEQFYFGRECMQRAEVLEHQWQSVCTFLKRWRGVETHRPFAGELICGLTALDQAWASFENNYVSDLISIDGKARQMVVRAIKCEGLLTEMERRHSPAKCELSKAKPSVDLQQDPAYTDAQRELVGCIARMNSVANTRGNGRDDLSASILAAARERLADNSQGVGDVLAQHVVDSFDAMRKYLQGISGSMDRLDPHLANNQELVARLVDWEESWEIGGRYVQRPDLLRAFSELTSELQDCQRVLPEFKLMCDDCDADLFLALPRLVWLWFLARPQIARVLMQTWLPKRFPEHREDDELRALVQRYDVAMSAGTDREAASRRLVQRAIRGFNAAAPAGIAAETAVEELLMADLESWSMELQRHNPIDWNQCTAVLLQCVALAPDVTRRSVSI